MLNPLASLVCKAIARAFASTPAVPPTQSKRGLMIADKDCWLPRDVHDAEWQDLTEAGFVFLEGHDRWLNHVRLPDGWYLQFNRQTRAREVRDGDDRLRAVVDMEFQLGELRGATMQAIRRYAVRLDSNDDGFTAYAFDNDTETRLFTTERWERRDGGKYFDARTRLEGQAAAWLNANFPEWQRYNSYR